METIFNFFSFCDNKIIHKIGYSVHEKDGNDHEKINFLKEKVNDDFQKLKFISIPNTYKVINSKEEEIIGIDLETYNTLVYNSTVTFLFEEVFKKFNAGKTPLFVITMVVNGKIKIEGERKIHPEPLVDFTNSIKEKISNHYFEDYIDESGFHLDKLIEDDFFKAIRLLFKSKYYTSSLKLLMSAIDTVAFLEYGDIPGNFKKWVNTYCDLKKIDLTSDEIWELRNSLLHMTNTRSRKVEQNIISQLAFYVSSEDIKELISDGYKKYFNLKTLVFVVADGFEKWGKSLNKEPNKFKIFFERYDLIISDTRYRKIDYNN